MLAKYHDLLASSGKYAPSCCRCGSIRLVRNNFLRRFQLNTNRQAIRRGAFCRIEKGEAQPRRAQFMHEKTQQ